MQPKTNRRCGGDDDDIKERKDPNTGATYYYNIRTNKAGWTREEVETLNNDDAEAVVEIEERIDPDSGNTYYYNTRTEKSGWTREEVETNEAEENRAGRSGASAASSATDVATVAAEEKERLRKQAEADEEALVKARHAAEEKARHAAEEKARQDAVARSKQEALVKAKHAAEEAEEQARQDAVARSKREAHKKRITVAKEAEEQARIDAVERSRMEAQQQRQQQDLAKKNASDAKKRQKDVEAKRIIDRVNNNRGLWYEILGVNHTASTREIKQAFRHASLKLHPDKCTCQGAEEAFKTVNQAYLVLTDASAR